MATAKSPTKRASLLPIEIGTRFDAEIFNNPISVSLSEPIISLSYILPSSKTTLTSVELSITW